MMAYMRDMQVWAMQVMSHGERAIDAGQVQRLYAQVWWPERSTADIDRIVDSGPALGAWTGPTGRVGARSHRGVACAYRGYSAPNYQFSPGESLRMVGSGSTYRDTALVARERAKRLRCDPESGEPRFSRHGSLVMDWGEVFAPVVFEPYRPREWPCGGSLLLDDLPFRVRDPSTGRHRVAFRIFAAMGYAAGRSRLWRLEVYTSKSQADGEVFLATLPGAPPRVVCDNHGGLANAVRGRFPDAKLYLCEWHLRHALERLMGKIRAEGGDRDVIDELLADVGGAFTDHVGWTWFVERVHAADIPRLSEWVATTGRVVEDQLRRRGQRSARPVEMPLSTSPLDGFINPIRAAVGPRAYGLKNRERTNRMLMLMQLHANHQDNEHDYVRLIRESLEANQGHPSVPRRAIIDTGRSPSLR